MNKENRMSPSEVKSTINSLECSVTKSQGPSASPIRDGGSSASPQKGGAQGFHSRHGKGGKSMHKGDK